MNVIQESVLDQAEFDNGSEGSKHRKIKERVCDVHGILLMASLHWKLQIWDSTQKMHLVYPQNCTGFGKQKALCKPESTVLIDSYKNRHVGGSYIESVGLSIGKEKNENYLEMVSINST